MGRDGARAAGTSIAGSFDDVDEGAVLGMCRTDGGTEAGIDAGDAGNGGELISTVRSTAAASLSWMMIDSSGTGSVTARRGGSTGFADA